MSLHNDAVLHELFHRNTFTNNTFNLKATEKTIRSTIENSFSYLKRLQGAYLDIFKQDYTEQDVYFDKDTNKIALSVEKDLVDGPKRRLYKKSQYYNQYLTFDTIVKNQEIFSYVPVVFIDGKSILSYRLKTTLDGKTEIIFTHFHQYDETYQMFVSQSHKIEVLFLVYTTAVQFTTNLFSLRSRGFSLPSSITKLYTNVERDLLFLVRNINEKTGSNFLIGHIDINGNFSLEANAALLSLFNSTDTFEITVFSSQYLHLVSEDKPIGTRVDNGEKSTILCLEEAEWNCFNMPIPEKNLMIFTKNISTEELVYQNTREATLHYPNIYEINGEDLNPSTTVLKFLYFYYPEREDIQYVDKFRYIHRYFARKLNSSYEESIRKLLYTNIENRNLQEYFFKTFNYSEDDYIYDYGDFSSSGLKPYDFYYKIRKLEEFIEKDPMVLREYAKNSLAPFQNYFLNVASIDLPSRSRMDTSREMESENDYYEFDIPFYVFAFRNELNTPLEIRLYIDGKMCTTMLEIQNQDVEYIYIPSTFIKINSYIEIEKFEECVVSQNQTFGSFINYCEMVIPEYEYIKPTMHDLQARMRTGIVSMDNYNVFISLKNRDFNISDIIEKSHETEESLLEENALYKDPISGELFVNTSYIEDTNEPAKFSFGNKIRIFPNNESVLNEPTSFSILKVPHIVYKEIIEEGYQWIELFNARTYWKEDNSYIRMFVNGRLKTVDIKRKTDEYGHVFVYPAYYFTIGDLVGFDVSPYSYQLEYSLKTLPENFIVDFEGYLTKPFDTAYYDAYLNGLRLSDQNYKRISANKIQIYNVKSNNDLRIYRKDRDDEYYGNNSIEKITLDFNEETGNAVQYDEFVLITLQNQLSDEIINNKERTRIYVNKKLVDAEFEIFNEEENSYLQLYTTDLDIDENDVVEIRMIYPLNQVEELMNSEVLTETEVEDLVFDIIEEESSEYDTVEKGTNTEWLDSEYVTDMETAENFDFYYEVLNSEKYLSPNDTVFDKETVENEYPGVLSWFLDDNRIIIRPNHNPNANERYLIGKSYEDNLISNEEKNRETLNTILSDVGTSSEAYGVLPDLGNDGTVISTLYVLMGKFGDTSITVNDDGIVTVHEKDYITDELNALLPVYGDRDLLKNYNGNNSVELFYDIFNGRLDKSRFFIDNNGIVGITKNVS